MQCAEATGVTLGERVSGFRTRLRRPRRFPRPRRPVPGLFAHTLRAWRAERGSDLAAALALYALLSLAPLLAILVEIGGALLGDEAVRQALTVQAENLLGPGGAGPIAGFLLDVHPVRTTPLASFITFAVLLWGAAYVFTQFQRSLNLAWGIERPRGGWRRFLLARLASIALFGATGVLLVVSHSLSVALSAVGRWAPQRLPAPLLLRVLDFGGTALVLLVLFALIYKALPDTHVPWRDVWIGASWTALLLTLGKTLIAAYLSRISVVTMYGTTISLVIVLVGVFSYAQVLLFGAFLTRVRSRLRSNGGGDRGGVPRDVW